MAGFVGMSAVKRGTHWLGRSGRTYDLWVESIDSFAMDEDGLYLLAKGRNVLWVGSTADLVADPMSRARFRLAMSCAEKVFRLATSQASTERLGTIYDLENGEPAADFRAQAA